MKIKRNILYAMFIPAFLLFAAGICRGQQTDGKIRTVVIDPGHGGKDPGTVYGNYKEKDITLAVGLQLGAMIEKEMPGVEVVYTRRSDVSVALDARGAIANKAKADLFISVHVNATDRKTNAPSGALTLIMGTEHMERNLDQAMKENQVIVYEQDYTTKYEEYLSGSSEMFIIYSLTQYVNIEQSINFANILRQYYKTGTPMPDKGLRRQKLLVLWYTTMPGILTELGFLNNEHDRKVLISQKGQKQMATAIFCAFRDYCEQVETKTKPLYVERDNGNADPVRTTPGQSAPVQTIPVQTAQGQDATPQRNLTGTPPAVASAKASDIVYRIQILSSLKKISPSEMKGYRGRTLERYDGKRYRYYVGECSTYARALEMQAEVRKSFPDAFMAAFNGESNMTIPEAKKLTDR